MKQHIDSTLRFTTEDEELVKRLKDYTTANFGASHGAMGMIIKRAIREFLAREEGGKVEQKKRVKVG